MRSTLVFAVTLVLIPWSWLAGDEPPQRERPRLEPRMFDRLDVNQDGVITLDEIPAERRERAARLIEHLDANGDGKVTREEFNEGIKRFRPLGDQSAERKRTNCRRRLAAGCVALCALSSRIWRMCVSTCANISISTSPSPPWSVALRTRVLATR